MLRILVVDDDTAVRGAIKMVLEQDGHEVMLASNGRAGVAAVEAGKFDLVICDIFMPGMDGIETISAFHRFNPQMPVIAMSGFMFRDGQTPAPDYLSLSTKLGAAYSSAQAIPPARIAQSRARMRGKRRPQGRSQGERADAAAQTRFSPP